MAKEKEPKIEVDAEEASVIRLYEVGYIFVPTIAEDKLAGHVEDMRKVFEDKGGRILEEGQPEAIELAYEIKKAGEEGKQIFTNAYFGWIKFELGAGEIDECMEVIEKDKNVIRFLIVKLPKDHAMHEPKHRAPKVAKTQDAPAEKGAEVSEEALDEAIKELVN